MQISVSLDALVEFSLIHLLNGKREDYKNVLLFVLYEWALKV